MNILLAIAILVAIAVVTVIIKSKMAKPEKKPAVARTPAPIKTTPAPAVPEVTDFTDEEFDAARADSEAGINTVEHDPVVDPIPATQPVPDAPEDKPIEVNTMPEKDRNALYDFDKARVTKSIDLKSLKPGGVKQLGDNNIKHMTNHVFQFEDDASFTGGIALNSNFKQSVIYLCDAAGKVHDYAISAQGRRRNEHSISYTKGTFPKGAFVVQVALGSQSGSTFRPPR